MALQTTLEGMSGDQQSFRDLKIDAPLGINDQRAVYIQLKGQNLQGKCGFLVTSQSKESPKTESTSHAKGILAFEKPESGAKGAHYQHLINDRVSTIYTRDDNEILKAKRPYSLFSRIVCYGISLKGLSSIIMAPKEAILEVEVPPRISATASSVASICDAAALDNFIHVAGISLNTSDNCATEEAFVAVGIESVLISPGYDLTSDCTWTVYASHSLVDTARARADIVVLSTDKQIALTINGINFARLPFKKLHLLQGANGGKESKSE